jgi:LmbE family N-acetylglucosaminyl deacetylase
VRPKAGKLTSSIRWLGFGAREPLRGRVVAVSPHLDDAVLSVGAALHAAARRGAQVHVVTVFAGDPNDEGPPSEWEERGGFDTAGAAAEARRAEDRAACRAIKAEPVWLSFPESGHEVRATDDVVGETLRAHLVDADTILVPGFPLAHPDHALAARLAERSMPAEAVVRYVEQPYAVWAPTEPRPEDGWWRLGSSVIDRVAKLRGARCYRSQLPLLGRSVLTAITRYEARRGGELAARRGEEAETV